MNTNTLKDEILQAQSQTKTDYVGVLKSIKNFNQGIIKGLLRPEQLDKMLEDLIEDVENKRQD